MDQCDTCIYYDYDEEAEEYLCVAAIDMDDLERLLAGNRRAQCPYYRPGDEYTIVRKQN